jgi:hypothetical protein
MLIFGTFGKGGTEGQGPAPAVLQEVRAYWESLREAGRLPLRSQIDPRGLAAALEQVFLIERIAPGHARFRLAGNLFHDFMGMDVRGMPLSCLFESVARHRLQPGIEDVFDNATSLHVGLEAERGIGRPALSARMLLLPLRVGASEPMMALGVMACIGRAGRAPRRFSISTLRTEVLFETEVVQRIVRKADLPLPHEFRKTNVPVVPREAAKRPALRLVHSRAED